MWNEISIRLLKWTTELVLKGAEGTRQTGQLSGGFKACCNPSCKIRSKIWFKSLDFIFVILIIKEYLVTLSLKITSSVSMTFTEIYFCSVLHYFSGKILQAEDLRKTNYVSSRILIKLFADSTLVDTGLSRGRPVRRKSLWNVLCVQDTFIFVSISGLVVGPQNKWFAFSARMRIPPLECWKAQISAGSLFLAGLQDFIICILNSNLF